MNLNSPSRFLSGSHFPWPASLMTQASSHHRLFDASGSRNPRQSTAAATTSGQNHLGDWRLEIGDWWRVGGRGRVHSPADAINKASTVTLIHAA